MNELARKISHEVVRLPAEGKETLPREAVLFLTRHRARCEGAPPEPYTWDTAPADTLERAIDRLTLCERIRDMCRDTPGSTHTFNTKWLLQRVREQHEKPQVLAAAARLATAKSSGPWPGESTVLTWYSNWKATDYDRNALVDQQHGRRPEWHGWEKLAVTLWLQTGSPSKGDVLWWLREHYGRKSATISRVRYLIDRLPAKLGKNSPYRIGRHNWQQNHTPHKERDISKMPAGYEYEGDGHTLDFYIAHPNTGNPVRYELTVFIDTRSQRVVAWNLWTAESAMNTLFTLARSIQGLNHVPARLHVDPGPGFENKQVEYYLIKNNIEVIVARKGNARGKGLVEGWFKHFEARCGRLFASYCGHGRVDDQLNRLRMRVARGEIKLPTLDEAIAVIGDYISKYNNTPKQGKLGGLSPNQAWELFHIPNPPLVAEDAEVRFTAERKVRSGMVQMTTDKGKPPRKWTHPELISLSGKKVVMEWSPFTYDTIRVRPLRGGHWIECHEIDRPDAVSEHELQAQERRSEEFKRKRLQDRIDEMEAHNFFTRDIEACTDQVLEVEQQHSTLLEHRHNPLTHLQVAARDGQRVTDDDDDIEIDILDIDY